MKRSMTGQHFVQDYTEGPNVRTLINRLPQGLFWRHVVDCSQDDACLGQIIPFDELSYSEVEDLDEAISSNKKIGRLDVPVNDPGGMGLDESAPHLDTQLERLVWGHCSIPNPLLDCSSLIQGHNNKQLAIGLLFDAVNRADI